MRHTKKIVFIFLCCLFFPAVYAQSVNGIQGKLQYHRAFKGEGLKDRDVVVWLPPGYDSTRERYPVLYLQDGQNIFDPSTSAFGKEWRADETADSLIRAKKIRPFIIVAIYNTPDRSDEYLPWKKNTLYQQFMIKTLKPFIDQQYRTRKEARYTFIGGASAGATIAFMMVWEHPDVFSKAICMSPAFRNPEGFKDAFNYIPEVKEGPRHPRKIFIYMDNGGKDLDQLLQPGVDEMIRALAAKNFRAGRDFMFLKDEPASHNEQAWASRLPFALERVIGTK